MKTADFDELLLTVDNVPLLCFCVAVSNIAGLVPAFGVEALRVGFGVLEVAWRYRWALNTNLAADVVRGDVFAVIVDEPNC